MDTSQLSGTLDDCSEFPKWSGGKGDVGSFRIRLDTNVTNLVPLFLEEISLG